MTDKLPPNLLALFAPRPGLRYIPATDHAPETRSTSRIDGVAQYLEALKAPSEDYVPTESWLQRRDRVKAEKREKQQKLVTEGVSNFDPSSDPQVRGDKYKTLFVARLSYEAKESDLEREFGRFGPIERIRIVTDTHPDSKKGKKKPHRGYAFIVYEREKDLKAAYKETNGIRIKDRRVLVDVERGRTVPDWRPRRFGGGKGGRGYTKAAPPRPAAPGGFGPPAGPGGGLRGGFRGGFGGDRGGGFRGGRGGFGQPRGGIGYQGGGGFGGRGGYGGSPNGFSSSAPPPNAPSGPGGSGRFGSDRGGGGGFGSGGYGGDAPNGSGINGGGYGDSRGGRSYDDRNSSFRGSRGFGDRGGDPRGASGSNREPVRPREDRGYGDRDRDRERGGYGGRYRDEDSGRKRHHDEDGYDDHRSKRRY